MSLEELIHNQAKSIISVVGPTCTGKTGLSIKLAKQFGLDIVNADSRLVFKEMDIGTAKPSIEERDGVSHHLIDVLNPNQVYSSGEYQKDFDKLIETKFDKAKLIVTGGTGMYLRSALENLDMPKVAFDENIREELDKKDVKDLYEELREQDPEACEFLDLNNKRRIIRALEVIKLSGKKYSEQRSKTSSDRYDVLWLGLNFKDRKLLYDLIDKRVYKMIEMGLVDEVQKLLEKYGSTKTLMGTIGYKEIILYLQNQISLDEAISMIQKSTRNYAKRQITWFKANPRINWFYAEDLF